jgi:hypothetical protein
MSSSSPLDVWEFELLATELDRAIEPVRSFYKAIGPYDPPMDGVPLNHQQCVLLFEGLLQRIQEWGSSLGRIVNHDMMDALGPAGKPGDAEALRASASKVRFLLNGLVAWENTVATTWTAAHWQRPFSILHGGTVPIFNAAKKLLCEIQAIPERGRNGETHVSISVDIIPTPEWDELPGAVKQAFRTGGSFIERHPIISGIIAGQLLSKIFR